MKIVIPRLIFEKYSNAKLHENPPSESRGFLRSDYGRTDGHDEANSRFSQYCERDAIGRSNFQFEW
jgi:hypothetical protein